jgi:hypothetical protein
MTGRLQMGNVGSGTDKGKIRGIMWRGVQAKRFGPDCQEVRTFVGSHGEGTSESTWAVGLEVDVVKATELDASAAGVKPFLAQLKFLGHFIWPVISSISCRISSSMGFTFITDITDFFCF